MEISVTNPVPIKALLSSVLTDKINDCEVFMKGIDYSYYYEQETGTGKTYVGGDLQSMIGG